MMITCKAKTTTNMTGMLWRDGSGALLAAKVERAAQYFLRKYGLAPNVCYVHPSAFEELDGTIEIRASRAIQPNYLWIGVLPAER